MLLLVCLFAIIAAVGITVCIQFRYQLHEIKQQYSAATRHLAKEKEKNEELTYSLSDLQDRITNSVLSDPLTGLPNRRLFDDRLASTVNQSERYQMTCGVMFLDLDEFKMVNDVLGYDVGDALLKEVAERLLRCVRQVDTVCRFGSDEFAIVFPQLSKAEAAAYIAQRILDAIAEPFQLQGQALYVTASIGVAIFPSDGADAKTILKNADNALNQAKLRGSNSYQFYRAEMHASSRRELLLSSSLRSNELYKEFNLYYQPQVNIESKKIFGMQVLLNWQHPDFGLIGFNEFLRLAENSGKIVAIGEWVLRTACRDFMDWQDHEIDPQAICVPLSLRQLDTSHFLHIVAGILHDTGLNPASIVFEISESSLLSNLEHVSKMLHMLKHLGVRIAMNNFGRGNLALSYLRSLPVDIFKIDELLVREIINNKESVAIVKMIVVLAKSLQADVVAEGVETEEQKQMLVDVGCTLMQGPLFSIPLLAAEFTTRLEHTIEGA